MPGAFFVHGQAAPFRVLRSIDGWAVGGCIPFESGSVCTYPGRNSIELFSSVWQERDSDHWRRCKPAIQIDPIRAPDLRLIFGIHSVCEARFWRDVSIWICKSSGAAPTLRSSGAVVERRATSLVDSGSDAFLCGNDVRFSQQPPVDDPQGRQRRN